MSFIIKHKKNLIPNKITTADLFEFYRKKIQISKEYILEEKECQLII